MVEIRLVQGIADRGCGGRGHRGNPGDAGWADTDGYDHTGRAGYRRGSALISSIRLAAVALLFQTLSFPQAMGLRGLVSGAVFDTHTRSIRPVIGHPGSASLGEPFASDLDFASVAPDSEHALLFQEGAVRVLRLGNVVQLSDEALEVEIPDGVAWSGDGSVAVLYSKRDSWLRVIDGLPANPVLGVKLDISIEAARVDLHGDHIATVTAEEVSRLHVFSKSLEELPVPEVSPSTAISFSFERGILIAADSATQCVLRINLTSQETACLAHFEEGPVSLAHLRDPKGRPAIAALGRDRVLRIHDAAHFDLLAEFETGFNAPAITALSERILTFEQRHAPEEPFWVLTGSPAWALSFVPAPSPADPEALPQ